jgi:hypothetical protein
MHFLRKRKITSEPSVKLYKVGFWPLSAINLKPWKQTGTFKVIIKVTCTNKQNFGRADTTEE